MMVLPLDARRLKTSFFNNQGVLCATASLWPDFCYLDNKQIMCQTHLVSTTLTTYYYTIIVSFIRIEKTTLESLEVTSFLFLQIDWFCQRLLWAVMVLALPASRSCRKPGDCGSGHLSYGQDSQLCPLGKEPFDKMSWPAMLLEKLKWVKRRIWPNSWHAFASNLRSAGYNVGIHPSAQLLQMQGLSASTCLVVARACRTLGLRLQCCVCAPAGQQHSAPHSHESCARGASCISPVCFPNPAQSQQLNDLEWSFQYPCHSCMVFLVLVARVVGRRGMPPCPPAPPGGSGPPASQLAVGSSCPPATSSLPPLPQRLQTKNPMKLQIQPGHESFDKMHGKRNDTILLSGCFYQYFR